MADLHEALRLAAENQFEPLPFGQLAPTAKTNERILESILLRQ